MLDSAALDMVEAALHEAQVAGAKALIVSGGRAGTFVAGADLRQLLQLDAGRALVFARRGQRLLDLMEAAPLISIAAIRGRCIGGAFDLVMACDLRLAAQDAVFSHPGPRIGFITGYGGTSRLPLLVGSISREVLSGRMSLGALQALRLGLVAEVVHADRLESRALEVADRIVSAGAVRARVVKEALRALRASPARRRLERRMIALQLQGG